MSPEGKDEKLEERFKEGVCQILNRARDPNSLARMTNGMKGCKGICHHDLPIQPKGGWYPNGFKRCMGCERYWKVEDKFCPCCGKAMRTKSRRRFGRPWKQKHGLCM